MSGIETAEDEANENPLEYPSPEEENHQNLTTEAIPKDIKLEFTGVLTTLQRNLTSITNRINVPLKCL